jgi:hypothetical protein
MSRIKENEEDDGPLLVLLKTGESLEIREIDGGGVSLDPDEPGEGGYEVALYYPDGEFGTIKQGLIAAVIVKATGQQVEFGNPYFEGHPRPQVLTY